MKMKTRLSLYGFVGTFALTGIVGCKSPDTVSEGIIYSVEYQLPGGGTQGYTRVNDPKAVPGGTGSWNVDCYGRLTREYLTITKLPLMGPQVIPASRLVSIQFGDGGIKHVDIQHPNPGK